jgi:hypothetical protein
MQTVYPPKRTKTVMTVGKSGLMWKLDRLTGKFLDVKE